MAWGPTQTMPIGIDKRILTKAINISQPEIADDASVQLDSQPETCGNQWTMTHLLRDLPTSVQLGPLLLLALPGQADCGRVKMEVAKTRHRDSMAMQRSVCTHAVNACGSGENEQLKTT